MKEKKIYGWMCVLNILLAIFTHIMTMLGQLAVFVPRESGTDDILHYWIFSIYRNNVIFFSEIFTAYIFDFTIILVIISLILRNFKKYVNSYRFLMASVWIKIVAYITCVFTNMVLSNCRIEGGLWLYVIGLALLIIAGFTTLFGTTEEMKKRNKKWDVAIGALCAIGFSCLVVIPTLFFVKEDSAKVKEIRRLLAEHPDTVREEVGYQIGNYCNGTGVYAEGKLYFIGSEQYCIYSVDKDGNYEEFYRAGPLYDGLYYNNGYLYAKDIQFSEGRSYIIRISLSTREEEILYEGTDIFDFGVAESKLYFAVDSTDGAASIYYIDLTKDNPGENVILYDTGVWRDVLNHNVFVARYLHNNETTAVEWSAHVRYRDNTVIYNDSIYRVDYFKYSGQKVNTPSDLQCQKFDDNLQEIVFDNNVVCINLFNETLYYVKEYNGNHYEVWCCDLQGNNKSLIGEVDVNSGGCESISVGEGFVYISFISDYDAEPYIPAQGFVMNIEDGNVQQIY